MRVSLATFVLFMLASTGTGGPGSTALPAEVLALRDVRVPAEVAGRVVKRPDDESAAVKAGDVVLTLDPSFVRAAARIARAGLRRAKARCELAKLDFDRVKGLLAKESVGKAAPGPSCSRRSPPSPGCGRWPSA